MDIITLLVTLTNGLIKAGQDFFEKPGGFADFEGTVGALCAKTAADYIGGTLSQMDEMLCNSGLRKEKYDILRHDQRTLISSVGDIHFRQTLFTNRKTGKHCYLLDELIHMLPKERFTTQAEVKVLKEAAVSSYQRAADSLQIGQQKVSKTAVMNKVRKIVKDLPEAELPPEEKKKCERLYIEADEDHIHTQKDPSCVNGLMGKLIYLFEGKQDLWQGKRILLEPHYFSGLYAGSKANKELWETVQEYISGHYDEGVLEKVYISGDGGKWIKSGINYVDGSVFVADKFHLMKYINRVAGCAPEDAETIKKGLYESIYKNKREKANRILDLVENSCENSEDAVKDCRQYLLGNWKAVQRAFRDPNVIGCSAEGHVSNVLSDRMSSRPMGWSKQGADSMCRLRCYLKNGGSKKIIDLVKYRREKEFQTQRAAKEATGTDGMLNRESIRKKYTKAQREAYTYVERLQASVVGDTVKKTLAIREGLYYI